MDRKKCCFGHEQRLVHELCQSSADDTPETMIIED